MDCVLWILLTAVIVFFAGYFGRVFLKKKNPDL